MVTICTTGFNIHKFHFLPTQCIYVFCTDLGTNSEYFPIKPKLTGFYNRGEKCLLRGTIECLNIIQVNLSVYDSLLSCNFSH